MLFFIKLQLIDTMKTLVLFLWYPKHRRYKLQQLSIYKKPCKNWQLAKITKINIGRGNRIRSADVQFANGHILQRPINMLYPIEMNCSN